MAITLNKPKNQSPLEERRVSMVKAHNDLKKFLAVTSNEETIAEYLRLKSEEDSAADLYKVEVRKVAEMGETKIIDDKDVFVQVVGKKKWDLELAKKFWPKELWQRCAKHVETLDAKMAQALVDAKELTEEVAKKAWVADTPAVTVKLK